MKTNILNAKRILSLFLVIAMVAGMLPMNAVTAVSVSAAEMNAPNLTNVTYAATYTGTQKELVLSSGSYLLDGATVTSDAGDSAITIADGARVYLYIKGTVTVKAGNHADTVYGKGGGAGIHVPSESRLIIYQAPGTTGAALKVTGGNGANARPGGAAQGRTGGKGGVGGGGGGAAIGTPGGDAVDSSGATGNSAAAAGTIYLSDNVQYTITAGSGGAPTKGGIGGSGGGSGSYGYSGGGGGGGGGRGGPGAKIGSGGMAGGSGGDGGNGGEDDYTWTGYTGISGAGGGGGGRGYTAVGDIYTPDQLIIYDGYGGGGGGGGGMAAAAGEALGGGGQVYAIGGNGGIAGVEGQFGNTATSEGLGAIEDRKGYGGIGGREYGFGGDWQRGSVDSVDFVNEPGDDGSLVEVTAGVSLYPWEFKNGSETLKYAVMNSADAVPSYPSVAPTAETCVSSWNISTHYDVLKVASAVYTAHIFDASTGRCTNCGTPKPAAEVNGVYQISNEAELYWFASWVNGSISGYSAHPSAKAVLVNDITVNNGVVTNGVLNTSGAGSFREWTPIGSEYNYFTGTFDGQGYTIYGLYTNNYWSGRALFRASKGTIKNVSVKDSSFTGGGSCASICALNEGTVENCHSNTLLTSYYDNSGGFGGIVSKSDGGTVKNCTFSGKITAGGYSGGIAGTAEDARIENCHSTGSSICYKNFDASSYSVGGVVGEARYGAVIINCSNSASVSGAMGVGGVVGIGNRATVTNCHNTGNVTGTKSVGGVVGGLYYQDSTLRDCYNTGDVTGEENVGGVYGKHSAGTVTMVYNEGDITGVTNVGGVGGEMSYYTATPCYNIGNVSGTTNVGGLFGYGMDQEMTDCYSFGNVTGTTNVGGLVGYSYYYPYFKKAYYCVDMNISSGLGVGNQPNWYSYFNEYSKSLMEIGGLTHMLNGSTSEGDLLWGQNLENQTHPVFYGKPVMYVGEWGEGDEWISYINVPHKHTWRYTVSGTTLSAQCLNADGECTATDGGSVTIAAPEKLRYTGSRINAVVTNNLTTGDKVTVVYTCDGSEQAPIEAGVYTASITLGDQTISVEYAIYVCNHEVWEKDTSGTMVCKRCRSTCYELTKGEHMPIAEANCLNRLTCQYCGLSYGSINKDNHISSDTWTCYIDDTKHGVYYDCCNRLKEEQEHSGTSATCTGVARCNVCHRSYGSLATDAHTGEIEWVSLGNQEHAQQWSCCGLQVGDAAAHNVEYSKDETAGTITATCQTCPATGTVTLRIDGKQAGEEGFGTKVYDGVDAAGDYDKYLDYDNIFRGYQPYETPVFENICTHAGDCNDVGTHTITMSLGGQTVQSDLVITQRPITITEVKLFDKGYDGTAIADIYGVYTEGVVIYSTGTSEYDYDDLTDDVSIPLSMLTATLEGSVPGTYTTAVLSGIELEGADAHNYYVEGLTDGSLTVPVVSSYGWEFSIDQRQIFITLYDQFLSVNDPLDVTAYSVDSLPSGFTCTVSLEESDGQIYVVTDSAVVTDGEGNDVTAYFWISDDVATVSRMCENHSFNANGFCATGECELYENAKLMDNGTEDTWDDYYAIRNAGQLFWYAEQVNVYGKTSTGAKLMNDITIPEGKSWTPINRLYAEFDGQFHTISGINCESDADYVGFMGNVGYGCTIKNLHITNSTFKGGEYTYYIGAIAASVGAGLENCYVDSSVTVEGGSYCGLLAGYHSNGGTIVNCYAPGKLVGSAYSSFENCYYIGEDDGYDGTTAVTEEQMKSGEVAYLLQSGVLGEPIWNEETGDYEYDDDGEYIYSEAPRVWGQTIGVDAYPVFGGAKVYQVTGCQEGTIAYSNTNENGAHTWVDGECAVCGKVNAKLSYYSISLNGNIALNFYMTLSEEVLADENAYMQFTMADKTVIKMPVSEATSKISDGDTYYMFSVEVAAKEMTDEVKLQFFFDGGSTKEYSYSVKSYADIILADADENFTKAQPLVKAMLNYGAAAQLQFNYNAETPAADLSAIDFDAVTAETLSSFANSTTQGMDSAKLYAASLILESETTLRLFFQTTGDITVTYEGSALDVKEQSGLKYVEIKDISAKDLDTSVTVTVSDGTNTTNVIYNPMTYCYNVLNAAEGTYNQKMIDAVKALYLYNQAANTYFA